MGFRDHGYYGYAFIGARPFQIVGLITVIGMVGHFVSQDALAHIDAPGQLVGALVISCLALLWSLLSFTAYDDSHFPYYATSAADLLFMIPFIVFAAVFGGPLSATTCSALPPPSSSNTGALLALQVAGSANTTISDKPSDYILFVGDNTTTCYEIMAVWGLLIALCVLFAISGFATGLLFIGNRRAAAAAGGPGGYAESQIEMASSYAGPGKAVSDAGSIHGGGFGGAMPPYPPSTAQ